VDDVQAYRARLARAVSEACRTPFGAAEVEHARRKALGRALRTFNAPESAAHWLLDLALDGVEPGAEIAALRAVTPRALTRRRDELLARPSAWSIVAPARSGARVPRCLATPGA
jgi:predicted Zn-dependent peptidase